MKITFPCINEKFYVCLADEEKQTVLTMDYPIKVQLLHGREKRLRYDRISEAENSFRAEAELISEAVSLDITDVWSFDEEGRVHLARTVSCLAAAENQGIRLTTEMRLRDSMAESFDDYQIVVPGAFFNKNDTDLDGCDDYLGTFDQDYKDDRNPGLSETVWCSRSGCYMALIRADLPVKDRSVTREQIAARHFIHDTDIGSLGFSPSLYHTKEIILRFDYPFYERNSFCLNIDASGWAAYRAVNTGDLFSASYILIDGKAENLTEACYSVSRFQIDRILNDHIVHKFTLEESRDARRELTFNSFRYFPEKKDQPAGFFVHFSPREGYGKQNILEYGFSGQQQMLSYVMLLAAEETGEEAYRDRALKTLAFFMKKCIHPSGIPYGLYDVDKEDYIFWWTGVLFPFQYSRDRAELEKYLGGQVVSAIMPIAEELQLHQGNYTRTMVDAMYYLWKCYQQEKKNGFLHEDWRDAVIHFCDTFISVQNENGSWNRAYSMEGEPLTSPVEWFGCNDLERGSGTIFPVAVMCQVYEETRDLKYLEAARRGAAFIRDTYVEEIRYVGGLNDTTHKKSVKADAVGVMFAMRALLAVYETTHEESFLDAAYDASKVLTAWTYLWDIPFDEDTLLGRHGFGTTGWAGCDVIPACSYVDDEFAEFIPELLRIAAYKEDYYLARIARAVFLGMQHGLSTEADMYEYKMAGVQCEGYMTSLWLSDTSETSFSGAVAKTKGDDNDTCNGLINGQQLATMHDLITAYGTMNMDEILHQLFDAR